MIVEKTGSMFPNSRLNSNENVDFLYKSLDIMQSVLLVIPGNPLGNRHVTSNLYNNGDYYFSMD